MAFQRGGTSHPTGPTQAITISAMTAPIQNKAISRGRENQRTWWIKEERATAEVCLGKRFPLRTQEACIFIVIKNNKALDAIQITRPGRSGSDRSAEARQHQNRGGRKNRLPRPRPNREVSRISIPTRPIRIRVGLPHTSAADPCQPMAAHRVDETESARTRREQPSSGQGAGDSKTPDS